MEKKFDSIEWCPHCDSEQPTTQPVQPCPNCGEELVACAMCKVTTVGFSEGNCSGCEHGSKFIPCEFDEETGMIIINDDEDE
jgi:predicted RNA-binding Zn-ribbon protein involved in translation (DUF1610 family)